MGPQSEEFATELEKESYMWLVENDPTIADSVALTAERGVKPEQCRPLHCAAAGATASSFSDVMRRRSATS